MAVAPQRSTQTVRPKRRPAKEPVPSTAPVSPTPVAEKPVQHRTVRLKDKAQVTIPYRIRRQLGLQEGDHFEVTVEDGKIVLEPVAVLSARGRRMIEEAEEDFRQGRYKSYANWEEGMEALKHAIGLG